MSKQELHPDFVEVCTLNGGKNLVVNDRRVCGPDYGGGDVGQTWNVRKSELLAALRSAPAPVVMPEEQIKKTVQAQHLVYASLVGLPLEERDPRLVDGLIGGHKLEAILRSLSSPAPTSSEYLQFTPNQTSSPAPVEGLFDPARLPERDTDGEQLHPDMAAFFSDESTNSEVVKKILAGLGWEMESAEWDAESCDAADWNPEPPEPNAGWFRVGFIDSEDGLFALFVRRLSRLEREAKGE